MNTIDTRPLLILDLDETLVYASERGLVHAPDFTVGPYALYRRPGVAEFLARVAACYRLAVWTSSSPSYATAVCEDLFGAQHRLEFRWASDRCTLRRDVESDVWTSVKRLRKVRRHGYDLDRVLVVDDSPEKHAYNYGNLVRVAPFEGDTGDDELAHLAPYLEALAAQPNLRRIEKRGWRTRE